MSPSTPPRCCNHCYLVPGIRIALLKSKPHKKIQSGCPTVVLYYLFILQLHYFRIRALPALCLNSIILLLPGILSRLKDIFFVLTNILPLHTKHISQYDMNQISNSQVAIAVTLQLHKYWYAYSQMLKLFRVHWVITVKESKDIWYSSISISIYTVREKLFRRKKIKKLIFLFILWVSCSLE